MLFTHKPHLDMSSSGGPAVFSPLSQRQSSASTMGPRAGVLKLQLLKPDLSLSSLLSKTLTKSFDLSKSQFLTVK